MSFDADSRAQRDESRRAALEAASPPPPAPFSASPPELLTLELNGGGGPMLLLKRVMRRLLREVLGHQVVYNRELSRELQALRTDVLAGAQAAEVQLYALRESELRIAALEAELARARERAAAQAAAIAGLEAEQRGALTRLEALDGEAPAAALDHAALADSFRGSEAELRERQRRHVRHFEGRRDVLDLGCGRGEFLELLGAARVPARGVDLDAAMVARCRGRGLDAVRADALAHLEQQTEGSLGGIFAAQLVEHLTTARLTALLALAHSRLRSGGVLVIESRNPQSLTALASFHLDPTRVRAVHPLALEWIVNSLGFKAVELEYGEPAAPERALRPFPAAPAPADEVAAWNEGAAHANDLLFGPQEYAIVARRP